ncbi:MAG: DNA polymerase domain-containing protein [Cetobacterium sp.]|uniref:DNA polymerase domain-containing protein n=1 Tax=Cetobacterium sp. TaxID=2071632 RepID=UPI003EE7E648
MTNSFYLSVDVIGDNICERYIEDGVEKARRVPFEPTLYHHTNVETGYQDIYERNVTPKTFHSMSEARKWMKRMKDMAQEACGMDDFALQYIYENYAGPISYSLSQIRIAYVDIEVHSRDGFPFPEICRWEIDAITHYDSVDDKYYVFTTREWWREKSILDKRILERTEYKMYQSERDMMLGYLKHWRENTPAIVTGWNSELFDIPYIVNRLNKLFGPTASSKLSPWGKVTQRTVKGMGDKEFIVYDIAGVASLDYLLLYKKFTFKTRPTYKLDYIGMVEVGEQKVDFDGKLWKLAVENPQTYIDYNIKDVDLIIRIDKSLLLLQLVTSLGYYSHANFDSMMSPLKTWDAIIYNSLASQNIVVPENKHTPKVPYEGAFVKDPFVGFHRWIMSFDLTSLYPHEIMQYNISPETIRGYFDPPSIDELVNKRFVLDHQGHSCAPNGMMYDKHKRGIIPTEIEKVFLQRKAAKGNEFKMDKLATAAKTLLDKHQLKGELIKLQGTEFFREDFTDEQLEAMTPEQLDYIVRHARELEKAYNVEQQAKKVLINSLYGALGNEYFRYFDVRNAEAITTGGKLSILWIERKLNEYFNAMLQTGDYPYCIYIDTDSVYLRLEKFVDMMLKRLGKTEEEVGIPKIVDMLDKFAKTKVEPYIAECYQEMADYMNAYAQKMFMDREVIADTGFWTAKKRYALNVWDSEGKRKFDKQGNLVSKLKIMGIETQRSSTPVYVQEALYESIRIILQEDQSALQKYFAEVKSNYNKKDYNDIAAITSANNIMQDASKDMFPLKGCRGPIKGVLAYNRAAKVTEGVDMIQDGEKVAMLLLKEPNRLGSPSIAYPSGEKIPDEFKFDLKQMIDYNLMREKHFEAPLSSICEAIGWDYEERSTLDFLFG